MKTLHELLTQKQSELARAAKEVDALRIAALLALDENHRRDEPARQYPLRKRVQK
jgi:hypothetical protein